MGSLAAGIYGLGAVWGWLAAQRIPGCRRPWRSLPAILLATVLLAALVLWAVERRAVIAFLGSAGISFLLNFLWLRILQAHSKQT